MVSWGLMWSLLHTKTPLLVAFWGIWVFREYREVVDIVGIVVDVFFTFDVNLHFMPGGKSICLMVGKLFLI